MDIKWEDYEKWAMKLAHKYHRLTGVEFEELVGETMIAFCIARDTYNPDKGAFTTHLYWKIRAQFTVFLKRSNKWPVAKKALATSVRGDRDQIATKPIVSDLMDQMARMGEDVMEIAQLAVSPPKAVMDNLRVTGNTPQTFLHCVKVYLEEEQDWKPKRVKYAVKEVKRILGAT